MRNGATSEKIKKKSAMQRSVTPAVLLTSARRSESHIVMLVARNVCMMARRMELNISLF